MLDEVVRFFTEALQSGIGFELRVSKLSYTDEHATLACCEFLADVGLILWYVEKPINEYKVLHVIPQPKY